MWPTELHCASVRRASSASSTPAAVPSHWTLFQHAAHTTLQRLPEFTEELRQHGSIYKGNLTPKHVCVMRMSGAEWALDTSIGVFTDQAHAAEQPRPDVSELLGLRDWQ